MEKQTSPAVPPLASKLSSEIETNHATVNFTRSPRFWGIFASMCLLSFISALDVSVITIALPTITAEIHGAAKQYVWIANSFVVASCVVQPLFGQLADAFGRRIPLMTSVTLFIVGSAIAGAAHNVDMLIAGRTIQGIGAGGDYVLLDIVCSDLVPLRERGKWLGLMLSGSGVAAAIGPPVGGAIAQRDWRWIFYLNIPFCGIALMLQLLFMTVGTGSFQQMDAKGSSGLGARFRRLDYVGNFLFIPSMVSLLLGIVGGGTEHPWSSWRIIVPLVLGVCGWIVFHVHQLFATSPSVPPHLFANRTTASAMVLTFTGAVLVQATAYFFPVYLQAVKGTTVLDSGTFFLPFAISTLVVAIAGGGVLTKIGKYKPIHAVGFALYALGFGLFTMLGASTSKVAYVFFELICGAGAGISTSTLLPAIMAPLSEKDVAAATATYSFIRTFGYIWGVTIPGVLFNAIFDTNLHRVSDDGLRNRLQGGAAYSFASQVHKVRDTFDSEMWHQVVGVYTKSLRGIWWLGLGFSLASLFAVALERSIPLRTELHTEYGLEHEGASPSSPASTTERVIEPGEGKTGEV